MFLLRRVPPRSCVVCFDSRRGTYHTYYSGWSWVGLSGFFQQPITTVLQDQVTSTINLTTYHDLIQRYPIITASKLPLTIDCSAHMRIADPVRALTTLRDIDSMVDAVCKSQLRNIFSTLDLDQIITTQAQLQRRLLAAINQDLLGYGVSCVGFTLTRVQLPTNIQQAVTKITSEQMQQRCALIEAQTKQKVLHIDLQLEREAQVSRMKLASLDHQALLKRLQDYRRIDPTFSLDKYFSAKFRAEAYSNCKSITLHEGNLDQVPRVVPAPA